MPPSNQSLIKPMAKAVIKLVLHPGRSIAQFIQRKRLAHCGAGVLIEDGVALDYPGNIRVGAGSRLARHSVIRANTDQHPGIDIGADSMVLESSVLNANQGHIRVGAHAWLGPFTLIYGNGGVDIGDHVLIAAHSAINSISHHAERTDMPMAEQGIYCDPVRIEDDVWLGLGVTVLQGVTIGRGSIVGAGSLVNKDIPPYSIAVGTPAKVIRQRRQDERLQSANEA